ncbi:hypothetical protein [Alkalihalobacillus deserti]|uniref:hypothetical protein n=1 Tax=Alkalihalobacillus deserti TaxID=2879466 RepID=UPI001D14931C|nr:hypothetical protein [Alkalihalobacillus deserti]
MHGKGTINNGKAEFTIESYQPNANLKGKLIRQNEKLLVEFIGDLSQYQGSYVGFETEFVRKRP